MCYNVFGDSMNQIDEIVNNLSLNENLSDDIKQNFLELILIFNRQFQNVDLTLLNERIKSLKLRPISGYLCSNTFRYDVNDNVLFFNEEKLKNAENGKSTMMEALLQVISNRMDEKNNILAAFNQGMDKMIAKNLVR